MFGVVTQLVTHTGLPLAPASSAPALTPAPVPTPVPSAAVSPPTSGFTMLALLGSTSRLIYSPLPSVMLFTESPPIAIRTMTLPETTAPVLPGGETAETAVLALASAQPSVLTSEAIEPALVDPVVSSAEVLPGSASTRSSTIATTPVTATGSLGLPSFDTTTPSDDDDDAARFEAVPRCQS